MKPPRRQKPAQPSKTSRALCRLAEGLAESATLIEDHFWQTALVEQLETLLQQGQEDLLTEALDSLFEENPRAHDALADHLEATVESVTLEIAGRRHTALLVAAPLLAWSRYSVPSGTLSAKLLDTLKVQLSAHVLASGVRLSLADYLFSPDQLPKSFCATRHLLNSMTDTALQEQPFKLDAATLPQTNRFLADVRYLLATVIVPEGQAVFRWQEPDGRREAARLAWLNQGLPNLDPLLSGCASQGLLPNAFHAACRQADRAIRPYAVQASVAFLQAVANLAPEAVQATIGPCYDQRLVEYRIALGSAEASQPYHGVVWPVLGEDEDTARQEPLAEIEKTLREAGVRDIQFLDHHFPLEFCDDCGAPFYPNRDAELVHAELPETAEQANMTLH